MRCLTIENGGIFESLKERFEGSGCNDLPHGLSHRNRHIVAENVPRKSISVVLWMRFLSLPSLTTGFFNSFAFESHSYSVHYCLSLYKPGKVVKIHVQHRAFGTFAVWNLKIVVLFWAFWLWYSAEPPVLGNVFHSLCKMKNISSEKATSPRIACSFPNRPPLSIGFVEWWSISTHVSRECSCVKSLSGVVLQWFYFIYIGGTSHKSCAVQRELKLIKQMNRPERMWRFFIWVPIFSDFSEFSSAKIQHSANLGSVNARKFPFCRFFWLFK